MTGAAAVPAGDRPLAPAAARQPRRRARGDRSRPLRRDRRARDPRRLGARPRRCRRSTSTSSSRGPRRPSARPAAASRPAIVGTLMLVADRGGDLGADRRARRDLRERVRAQAASPTQVRLWLDVLNGFPSIVIGIFVFALASRRSCRSSASATTRAPGRAASRSRSSCCRSSRARRWRCSRSSPTSLREASYALGVSKWRTVLSIVLPSAIGGIVTGTTLAVARAAGETAPLLFTCALREPVGHLEPLAGRQLDPVHDLQLLASRRRRPARAGLGGGLHR